MKPLSLYVHIPFCRSKCVYCDFASWANSESRIAPYLDALREELFSWRNGLKDYELTTMFIGGGTPSLLTGEQVAALMEDVRSVLPMSSGAEITMEANPGTTSLEQLEICRQAGVNRISFGAQALDDGLLKKLGRIHSSEEIAEAVRMARDAGFDNLNLDLMYALPGQNMELWMDTLDRAVKLGPEHISAYSLIVEEGTPMHALAESGSVLFPDDDACVDMQRAAIDMLGRAGYHRYEISNYARPGMECRHNIVYWERGEYLGLGCAAHSLMKGERFENPRSLDDYLAGVRRCGAVKLTRSDAMEEALMLATRMTRGLDLAAYEAEFGEAFVRAHGRSVRRMEALGLVKTDGGFLRLTRKGLEVQNSVVVELLDE